MPKKRAETIPQGFRAYVAQQFTARPTRLYVTREPMSPAEAAGPTATAPATWRCGAEATVTYPMDAHREFLQFCAEAAERECPGCEMKVPAGQMIEAHERHPDTGATWRVEERPRYV